MVKSKRMKTDLTITNMSNNSVTKYRKQKLTELQGDTDNSTITIRDFHTPLSTMDRTIREKINKDIEYSHNTMNYSPNRHI